MRTLLGATSSHLPTTSTPGPDHLVAPRAVYLGRRLRSFLRREIETGPSAAGAAPPRGRTRKCSYGGRRVRTRLFTMATAGASTRFCRCACFCSENLYVARYGLHVRFRGEEQLRQDYGPVSGRCRSCRERGGKAGGGGTFVPTSFALPACSGPTTRMAPPLRAFVVSP